MFPGAPLAPQPPRDPSAGTPDAPYGTTPAYGSPAPDDGASPYAASYGAGPAYGAAPVRQYVIGKDGVVTYHGGAGPHFLDLYDWAEAIKSTIS